VTADQPNGAAALLQRLRSVTLLRYLVASALSLGIDLGSFMALLAIGAAAAPAAAAGYTLGILAHWLISSRKVFADSVAARGLARTRQKAMFVISALVGLGLTTLMVGVGSHAGIDPRLAKLAAIATSFTVTWLLRSRIIFTDGPPTESLPR
jgi:putative flippase GtrA